MADEKVLDVPAIDMTDAGLAKRKPAKRGRTRDGSIGRATFDAVNESITDGSMTKQAAFAVYGKQTKTEPGTVSANCQTILADGLQHDRHVGQLQPAERPHLLRITATRRAASEASARSGVCYIGMLTV